MKERKNKERSYPNKAIRKRRAPSDVFFQLGNEISLNHYNKSSSTVNKTHILHYYDHHPGESSNNGQTLNSTYVCEVNGCSFESMRWLEYEEHYMNHHVNICSICLETDQSYLHHSCCFVSLFLLDLHIEEFHHEGGLFVREHEKYRCLEESCGLRFESDELRLNHLKIIHGYPRWFRFLPRIKKYVFSKARQKFERRGNIQNASSLTTANASESSMLLDGENNERIKRTDRKQRQKERRASIPCKFFLSEKGCWRGDKCMFLHDCKTALQGDSSMEVDDTLSEEFQKVSFSVPEKLTFGRRCRK